MDSLKCSKCITFLSKNNIITFSCSHILCKECIFHSFFKEQFSILKNLIYTNKIKIDCPICQKGNIELDSNIFLSLLNIKETENLENKVKNPNCKMHKKKSEFYCEQCSQYYCNDCIKIHNEIGNSHHKLLKEKNEISEFKCSIHEMKINNFCLKCNEMICNCCLTFNHSQHQIIKLKQYIQDCFNNLDFFKNYNWDYLIQEKLSSNNNFENVYKETLENSIKQIDDLIKVLNSYKKEYIEKMEQIHLTQININKILLLSYDKIKIKIEYIKNCEELKKLSQLYKLIFLNDVYKMFQTFINEKKNDSISIQKKFLIEDKSHGNLFKNSIFIKDELCQSLINFNKKSFLSSTNSNNKNFITSFPSKVETFENSLSERNKKYN